jgi:hypothetical protein
MLKEDLFSAKEAQTLPHAKVYNETDKFKYNLQLNGYFLQFIHSVLNNSMGRSYLKMR